MPTPAPNPKTPALESLRETYDTTQLLQLVDALDEVRCSVAEPSGLRDDLLRLHVMAHALINGGPLSAATSPAMLGELATEFSMEVERLTDLLDAIRHGTEPLEALAPGDEMPGSATGRGREGAKDSASSTQRGQ